MHYDLIITSRLFIAAVLGGIIGWQRERLERPAGFRTHILVSVGTALFTLIGLYSFGSNFSNGITYDPSRIAAQIVTGVGFLGGGTIMRHKFEVKGLTTAASIWCTSAIGMSVACGLYWAGIFVTLLSFIILEGTFERYLFHNKHLLKITIDNKNNDINNIISFMKKHKVLIKDINISSDKTNTKMVLDFLIRIPLNLELSKIIHDMNKLNTIESIEKIY